MDFAGGRIRGAGIVLHDKRVLGRRRPWANAKASGGLVGGGGDVSSATSVQERTESLEWD